MTEVTRAIVRRELEEMRWSHLWLRGAVLVGVPLLAAYAVNSQLPRANREIVSTLVLGALGIGALVAIWLTAAHRMGERAIRRDIGSTHYLQTTGRLTFVIVSNDEGGGSRHLYLDDLELRSPWGWSTLPPFDEINVATVDHSPHANVVFAIIDPERWMVYVAEGYAPPAVGP